MPTTLNRTFASKGTKLLFLAMPLVVLIVYLLNRTESEVPDVEVLRKDLVLQDGRLHWNQTSEPFTGLMIERYEDGVLKARTSVVDGLLDGLSAGWYTNKQLQVREHFNQNVSHGLRQKWNDAGKLMSESTIQNGEHHGVFRRWYENGQLAEEVTMVNGVADGPSQSCFPSGYLKARVLMKQGEVVEEKFWEDGEELPESKKSEP